MALTSSLAALATATALLVLVVVAQLSESDAAAALPLSAPIGLRPDCKTTCGNVIVPYPFGIQPGCFRPGFNLTCDTRQNPPRLLLGKFRVADIFLDNSTMRVYHDGPMEYGADNITSDGLIIPFARSFSGGPYKLPFGNELVLFGCNVLATLVADKTQRPLVGGGPYVFAGCASVCSGGGLNESGSYSFGGNNQYCSGSGCCQVSISTLNSYYNPTELHLRPLDSSKHWDDNLHVSVFLAEEGWLEQRDVKFSTTFQPKNNEIPLLLEWDNTHGLALSESDNQMACPRVFSDLCKSNHSDCGRNPNILCVCKPGYGGNPYVDGGCQAANAEEMVPAQIGQANCDTTCGDVRVPYPFGFGPPHCYLTGFGLTCDKSQNPPRLLLDGNGTTLQVVDIFLNDSTMRVIHTNTFDVATFKDQELNSSIGQLYQGEDEDVGVHFPDMPYMLSSATNEFILTGCNVEARLHGQYSNTTAGILGRCVSTCSPATIRDSFAGPTPRHTGKQFCSSRDGCCHVQIPPGSRPKKVEFKRLPNWNMTRETPLLLPLAFVAEEGQIDQWYKIFNKSAAYYAIRNESWSQNVSTVRRHMVSQVPLVLRWVVKQQDVRASAQSICQQDNGGYTCHCTRGYDGNPYIINGCKDINECRIPTIRDTCFGYCHNFPGSYECRCPQGTHGNPYLPDGCVPNISAFRKVKQHRTKLLKQKYFKQNRGQLLQQLVSQRADIAERMIIPVNELAKATNNFDKARELGGGGHGTVYKARVSLSWKNRMRIATETAQALAYLHSSVSIPIIHRDIKSSNILLDDTLTAKVSDFGASRYIPVDKTGLTTIVQGTIGYLDPMCFCTGRLNEKSDVYSFGVILVELLTRKKPFSYLSSDDDGLVMHFTKLHASGKLSDILDPQVKEEGGKEVEEVATLAALCIKMNSDDRPTMRQVEHTLEGLQASKKYIKINMATEAFEEEDNTSMDFLSTKEGQSTAQLSRRYSLEHEFQMSARYPR
ncbi:hypothetical protein PR202_gb23321 [Eleusine coracana subsp. coracana]|uniref:Protein kinase domain-containing protein n=1 Tax=Eleusine coracana subsp. coracana TaxID=191504 RepID=A0AAV5FIJ0_ELECO|nr:hypothetical protein PR202_gb23321 [Eleusine coracana subsp. coracana]